MLALTTGKKLGRFLGGSCLLSNAAEVLCLLLQTSIVTEGFRSLAEGEAVEFYVEAGDDGRTKAVNVTGPGGAPPQVGIIDFQP